ncbi:urease accessory protein UreD [Acidisoma cladoniae]|uniref:urease accessory protein UreD n=1 Tax=Acidisoma cladoniae TaxID=3040935 RepID=UPI00254DAD72|nr:urease accessory protein UreD [Acidisoma sp. PAMC 29798]
MSYPFHVTSALRNVGPDAQVIVQSVSGGFFGGEVLGQRIAVGAGGQATVSFPSAAVVHAQGAKDAPRQSVLLHAEAGATLAYLPRPLILFPGGALIQAMDITVAEGSAVMMRDGVLMHDPHGMAAADRRLDSRITVRRASGHIIALDRMQVTDGLIAAATPGVTHGFRAFGSVWLIRQMDVPALKAAVAEAFAHEDACYVSTTALRDDGGALIRVAARDGGDLEVAMDAIHRIVVDPSTGETPQGARYRDQP